MRGYRKSGLIRASRLHLGTVGEGYREHLKAALAISFRLARASAASALHALVPGACTHRASEEVAALNAELMKRSGARPRDPASDQLRAKPSHVEISSS